MNLRWPVLCGLFLSASVRGEEGLLADATRWQGAEFAALFPVPTVEAASISRVAATRRFEVFGSQPMAVSARWVNGGVHSISVVIFDAGSFFGYNNSNLPKDESFEAGELRFDKVFSERLEAVLAGLKKLGADGGTELVLGKRSGLNLKTQLFKLPQGAARLMSYEHQLLLLDFFRSEADARSLLIPVTIAPAKAPAGSTERRLPVVPMVPQGNRGYCGVATLAMVGSMLGLQLGAEEYAALSGFQYGIETKSDIRELFGNVAQEAGVKALRSPKFDAGKMKQSIDQGMPVVVFRYWAEERDYIHSAYSTRIARGEKAELPAASMDDRKTWPKKSPFTHASIVNGYRADKREAIFTESWGEQARNRRMRVEEMEGTSYYAVYFGR
ncbi:MAG: hypothetical protein B7Z37_17515 [Verrucomicrobia bacterium 12-59-8]|nr:MAG: hypothetical protein B7Z37_17515 [Verrucomicrobia bacterium 12-59-8]